MSRALPVLIALLLLLCSPAAAFEVGASSGMTATPTSTMLTPNAKNPVHPPGFNNTSAQLNLGTPDRSETYTPSLSLSTSLEMDRNELQERKRRYTLDEKLSNATSSSQQRKILIQFRTSIELQYASLQDKERKASHQFNNQEIETKEYLKRLAMIDANAQNIRQSVEHMKRVGESVIRFAPREAEHRTNLIPVQGPVRSYAANAFREGGESNSIYVETTHDGVVLSMVDDNQYLREAYRSDYRNRSTIGNMDGEERNKFTLKQYPWAKKYATSKPTDLDYQRDISRTRIYYPQGFIMAYLDSGTKKIYREIQKKLLSGESHIPYGTAVQNTSAEFNLVVNRTYPGGPVRINLTNGDGNPVSGHIELDGAEIGETNSDGTIWTVAPRRTFTVTATHGSKTLNVTVTPYGLSGGNSTKEPNGGESSES